MRILIAEDDKISRKFLFKLLSQYGECDLVMDGLETLDAFILSIKEKMFYDLICLDIMMPKVDGIKILKAIRDLEKQNQVKPVNQVKIIMTTALAEKNIVEDAFDLGCNAYATKPIEAEKFITLLNQLKII